MKDQTPLPDRSIGPLSDGILRMLEHVRLPICVTDPHAPDNPIVYVNSAFLDLTGYEADEVLGRNCRFLQGEETTPESIAAVRTAVEDGEISTVEIVNYRKDGSRFDNALQIGPVLDEAGDRILLFGSQLDVTERRTAERRAAAADLEERSHRLRNIVNVMAVAVRMTAREAKDVAGFAKVVTERLQHLGEAHFRTFEQAMRMPAAEIVMTILRAYAPLGDRQINASGPEVMLSPAQLTPLTLALHELATNSVKHGSLGDGQGRVRVEWNAAEEGEGIVMVWTERDGPPVIPPEVESGSRIVSRLMADAGGGIEYDWQADGLVARLTLPG